MSSMSSFKKQNLKNPFKAIHFDLTWFVKSVKHPRRTLKSPRIPPYMSRISSHITSCCIFFHLPTYRHAYICAFLLILTKMKFSCIVCFSFLHNSWHGALYYVFIEICWLLKLAFYIQTAEFLNDSQRGGWLWASELMPLNQWLTNRVSYQGNELVDH